MFVLGESDDVLVFARLDLDSWTWSSVTFTGSAPPAISRHTACVDGAEMIVFGGVDAASNDFLGDIFVFDFETSVWSQPALSLPLQPCPRSYHAAWVTRDRKMVVYGGEAAEGVGDMNKYRSDVFLFDIETRHWLGEVSWLIEKCC